MPLAAHFIYRTAHKPKAGTDRAVLTETACFRVPQKGRMPDGRNVIGKSRPMCIAITLDKGFKIHYLCNVFRKDKRQQFFINHFKIKERNKNYGSTLQTLSE